MQIFQICPILIPAICCGGMEFFGQQVSCSEEGTLWRVMKTVSEGTKEIIIRRARMDGLRELFQTHAALALCNGNVCDLIYASDLAQKTSEVEVFEISGNCPQHLTCLAILGSAAAVDEAVERIRSELGG